MLRKPNEAIEALRDQPTYEASDDASARVELTRAAAYRAIDRQDQALQSLINAERSGRAAGMKDLLTEIEYQRGSVLFPLGDFVGSQQAHQRSLEHARQVADRRAEARALSGIGDARYAATRLFDARAAFEEASALARTHELLDLATSSEGMLAFLDLFDGKLRDGTATSMKLAERASTLGLWMTEAFLRTSICFSLLLQGRIDRLMGEARRSKALAEAIQARRFEALSRAYLSIAYASTSRLSEGRAELEQACSLARDSGFAFSSGLIQVAERANALAAATRPSTRDESEELFMSQQPTHSWFLSALVGVEEALREGDAARALLSGGRTRCACGRQLPPSPRRPCSSTHLR